MSRRRPLAIAVAAVACVAALVALYVQSLPENGPTARPPATVQRTPSGDDLADWQSAERAYDRDERAYRKAASKEHDTALVDACTGKPIPMGQPTTDVTGKADCRRPPTQARRAQPRPKHTTHRRRQVVVLRAPKPHRHHPGARRSGLTDAEWARANRLALASATYCLRLSQMRRPTNHEVDGEVLATIHLPELLRTDPDTYRIVPGSSERETMRQLVGEVRDGMVNGCDESGAQKLNTALETLPR
jgi:hypothetical protein